MTRLNIDTIKIGIAGVGAIGGAVAKALSSGIHGYKLHAISDKLDKPEYNIPNVSFDTLIQECDLIIECLPPQHVGELAKIAIDHNKDLILISSCALLTQPEILEWHKQSTGRIIVPSGALIGLDGINTLKNIGIQSAKIASTKPPRGFSTAPFVEKNGINLDKIDAKTLLFSGNALEAADGFPANVNVAATLSLAGIGAQNTNVEVWADPQTIYNTHEITVTSAYSQIYAKVENKPDPQNPKSSALTAQSIIAVLKGFTDPFVVL